MARMTIATFDELVKFAGDFVASRKGVWDHAAWLDFVSNIQKKGFDLSEEMQAYLGEVLEAMKRFYEATGSTEGMESAMRAIVKDSIEFTKKQKGVWGHTEWEAFATGIQKNTLSLSEETTAYLGGILESVKAFYFIAPAPAGPKKVRKRAVAKVEEKPAGESAHTKDDLTVIAGIGPALQKKLNEQGIYSYAQIAGLSAQEIDRLEETIIKFPGRIKRDDWVGQAKKLSHGNSAK